jgi:hypothetical protein
MLKWLFHNADYFSQPVLITFNNEEKYSSLMGKILSVIIYSITLLLILTSCDSLQNRRYPKTSTTNYYQNNAPLMNLPNHT